MKKQLTLRWALGLLLFFSANLCFAQTNYYVDPLSGDDGNSGLIGSPTATIQAAIGKAVTPAVINIAAGTYAENLTISKPNLTLKGAGSGTHQQSTPDAVNPSAHTVLSKATGRGITISGARTNVKIMDLIIQGFALEGIQANTAGCDGFTAERLQVLNCGGQAGLYVSGDVNGVTINDVASMNNTGRALVVWNNFKQNVSITNCHIVLGACCGIELQDGTASGVHIANNTIIGGAVGDSGIGLTGLKGGAGPNIIENNTITMSKRYGIEIKNPAGTGTEVDTEDGAIIVRNNSITRTGVITEVKDLAGIAIFRRGFLTGNTANYIDVPSGVVVTNNTITGFVQSNAGTANDGFGVVAEGVNMTIKNNNIQNCDIGVQRQSGNSSGYVKNNLGDADQTADNTYFNRGNSPFSSAINVSGNTFSGNTSNIRDVFAVSTYFSDTQYVINADQKNAFATIGLAVENAVTGNTLKLSANTFDERIIIDKSLTIDGVDNTLAKVTYTGPAITSGPTIPALFNANAQNITIKNIEFTVNLDKVHSAINSKGDVSGINITDNRIVAANFGGGALPSGKLAYGRRNAVAINIDPFDGDYQNVNTGISGVTIQRNVVDGYIAGSPANGGFRAGFQVDRAKNVLIGGNTAADANTSQAINHDVICRFFTDGDVTVKNNIFNGGGLEMSTTNSPLGTVTVEANTFDGVISNTYSSLARLQVNTNKKAFVFKDNIFKNVNRGISLENFNSITLDGNTFTPSVDGFRLVMLNTKSLLTTNPPTTETMGVLMINNIFNGLVGSTSGTAVAFYNHNEDGSNKYAINSSYVLGKFGQENSFNANIKNYILLDNSNGVLTNDPAFQTAYPADYSNIPATTTAYWTPDVIASENKFDIGAGLALTSSMDATDRTTLKTFIQDKDDNVNLGEVVIYFPVQNVTTGMNFNTIQAAIDDVNTVNGNVINVKAGTYDELITINKSVTLTGADKTTTFISFTGTVGGATPANIKVTAPNVTIQNFTINDDFSLLWSAIVSSGDVSGLNILNNNIKGFRSSNANATGYGGRNAININTSLGNPVPGVTTVGSPNGVITIKSNDISGTVAGTFTAAFFRAGVSSDGYALVVGGDNVIDGNTIQSINHDVINRFQSSAAQTILKNNTFNGGGVELLEPNAGFSGVIIENNSFSYSLGVPVDAALLRLKNNDQNKPYSIKNNTFTGNFWLTSLENFRNATFDGNTFSPVVNGNNTFKSVTINTKTLSSNLPATQNPIGATFTNNTFNGVSGSINSKAISFLNHYSNAAQFGNFVLGTAGNNNTFNNDIVTYLYLDNDNGNATTSMTAAYPEYAGVSNTTTGYWTPNLLADQNSFFVDGQLRSPSSLTSTQQGLLDNFIFDKKDDANVGLVSYYFPVQNVSTGNHFSTIQAAIDDATTVNGNVINVNEGTYTLTTAININKEITLQGNSNVLATKPLITGTGGTTFKSLIYVSAPNVTVRNFHLQFAEQNANSGASVTSYGIRTAGNGTFDNLSILDNTIEGTNSAYVFNSYGIFLGAQSPVNGSAKVTIKRNTIGHTQTNNALGRGIRSWYVNGAIGGSLADGNDIKAFYASMELGVSGGTNPINVSYNNLFGKFKIGGLQVGNHLVSHNNITTGGAADASAQGPGVRGVDMQPALIEVVSARTDLANLELSNNTLSDFKYAGIALFASSNISILNNTLTPFASETGFTHILFETKTTDTQPESAKALKNITIKGNNFNSSGVLGGRGLFFANSNGAIATVPLSSAVIGGPTTEANTFAADLASYVELDAQSGASSSIPLWTSPFYSGTPATTVIPFSQNIDIAQNKIGIADLSTLTDANFYDLEAKITHGLDNGITGFVTVKSNYAYTASGTETERAMSIVPDDYTVLVKAGTDLTAANLLSKHDLTLNSEDAIIALASIGIDAAGKSITLSKPTTSTALNLTAGKVVTSSVNTLTVPASGMAFTSGIGNFVDGPLSVTGISSDQVIPVGKGAKAAYIGLSGVLNGPSNFNAEYLSSAYADVTNKEASLGNISVTEHWILNRTSGALTGNVQLYSFDQAASGLAGLTPLEALVAWYDGTEWKNQGNGNFDANSITALIPNALFSPFTFAKPPTVLPVELISFNAIAKTQGALISWSTASESGNDYFEVQKSVDGILFTKIGTVKAGTSSQTQSYEYLDGSFNHSAYYQLVQVNNDGTRKVYADQIKFVKGLGNDLTVSVYPNPTNSNLYVKYNSQTAQSISGKLLDLSGRTIQSFVSDSSSALTLDLSKQQPGVYVLQINTAEGVQTRKIIKQ